jgi:hypothetical protein
MGWPETISMSDTLVIAEVLPSPAASPRLVHFRAMQPGTSHVTASFRQAEKVLTVVVSP